MLVTELVPDSFNTSFSLYAGMSQLLHVLVMYTCLKWNCCLRLTLHIRIPSDVSSSPHCEETFLVLYRRRCAVWVCVNVFCSVKALWVVIQLRKAPHRYSPFTDYLQLSTCSEWLQNNTKSYASSCLLKILKLRSDLFVMHTHEICPPLLTLPGWHLLTHTCTCTGSHTRGDRCHTLERWAAIHSALSL